MKKIILYRFLICFLISFGFNVKASLPCLSGPIASNTAINDCVNTPVTGNLAALVTGGSGPLSFGPFGAPIGGGVNIGSTGPFTFTPSLNFSGSAGFDFQVTDSAQCTATATVGITVLSPIVTSTSFVDCSSTAFTGDISSLASSGFPPYTFSIVGLADGGIANVSANGIFTFTPNPGFNGQGGFVFLVTDSNNCNGTGSVDIAIGSPITATAALSTCNPSINGDLNNFATGGTPPLFFDGPVGAISCPGASVTINPDGTFNFTAPIGFTGPCSFVYEVFDNNECNSTGAVTIIANLTPIAKNALYFTCKNEPIVQTLQVISGVAPLNFIVSAPPIHGILNLNAATGEFTYTPNVGFVGNDSFQFFVVDSSIPPCTSNIATVNIRINDCCITITNPFFSMIVSEFNNPPI